MGGKSRLEIDAVCVDIIKIQGYGERVDIAVPPAPSGFGFIFGISFNRLTTAIHLLLLTHIFYRSATNTVFINDDHHSLWTRRAA